MLTFCSDILPETGINPQQSVSSIIRKRKNTFNSELREKKSHRHHHTMQELSRPTSQDQQDISDAETSDSGSFHSATEVQTHKKDLKVLENRISSLEDSLGEIVEERISKILKQRLENNAADHPRELETMERSLQQKPVAEDRLNEEEDIYGV